MTGAVRSNWVHDDVEDEQSWVIALSGLARSELLRAATASRDVTPDLREVLEDPVPGLAELAGEVRHRLTAGPRFVVLRGFPVHVDEATISRAYWLLGLHLGRPVMQSRKGDLIGRVEDRGSDISDPTRRGYESSAALPFHVDRTDLISLLCVRSAARGGLSRLASSETVHDILAEEQPELLAELCSPLPHDRRGEERPDELPWTEIPVFSQVDGRFAARYVRRFVEGSQRHRDAPRLTRAQRAALDAMDEVLARPSVHLDMELRPGDVQLVDNFSILHSRTAFTDAAEQRSRLLLRLWLAWSASPPLPASYEALYGAVAAGSYRGGVWPDRIPTDLVGRPVGIPA